MFALEPLQSHVKFTELQETNKQTVTIIYHRVYDHEASRIVTNLCIKQLPSDGSAVDMNALCALQKPCMVA